MKRRLFIILSVLSLLLFVAVVVMWVRSYDPGDYVRHYHSPSDFELQSSGGLLRLSWGHLTSKEYAPEAGWDVSFWRPDGVHYTVSTDLRKGTILGFGYDRWRRQTADIQADMHIITLPYWSLAATSAVLPVFMTWRWMRNRRARRRMAQGLCLRCGYDIRVTPERCPECGHVPAPPPSR